MLFVSVVAAAAAADFLLGKRCKKIKGIRKSNQHRLAAAATATKSKKKNIAIIGKRVEKCVKI